MNGAARLAKSIVSVLTLVVGGGLCCFVCGRGLNKHQKVVSSRPDLPTPLSPLHHPLNDTTYSTYSHSIPLPPHSLHHYRPQQQHVVKGLGREQQELAG